MTVREAAVLYENLDSRTLHQTEITLPTGTPALVRTLCLVFDDDAATRDDLTEDHVPQVFASAVYWGEDYREFVQPLWTYGSPEEAQAAHREAVEEFRSGRARVAL
ncbi:hypothetical protein [Streptomyces werraensis]|uniref:hypothetical protein n=1 Tax=Streptomyces werraensis TaxID=68284 RepID=UPI003440F647